MTGNKELTDLLDREFRCIESAEKKSFPTVKAMADHLELDKTYLSKLRSGERVLTKKKARYIAERLRKQNPTGAVKLEEELLAANQVPSQFLLEISDWFNTRAKRGNLMFVEFRELPVVRPHGGRAYAAKIVGEAVADGLDYAMVNPFSTTPKALAKIPRPLLRYVLTLDAHLIEARRTILDYAFDHAHRQNASLGESKLRAKLLAVTRHLKLYCLSTNNVSACPGLGYRLFYTECQEPSRTKRVDSEPTGGQLWEWISSKEQDHMVLKEATFEALQATTIRFFPLVEFWRENNCLPQNDKEIADFAAELENRESYAKIHGLVLTSNSSRWTVIGVDDETIVNKYLQSKATSKKGKRNST